MFEVDNRYKTNRSTDIATVLMVKDGQVVLQWEREKRLFTLHQRDFGDGWKEHKDPVTERFSVYVKKLPHTNQTYVSMSPPVEIDSHHGVRVLGRLDLTIVDDKVTVVTKVDATL